MLNIRLIRLLSPSRNSWKRLCSSVPANIQSKPPFPLRALIIGSTVGLATPFLAIGGAVQIWLRVLPKSILGRVIKYSTGLVIGGGSVTLLMNHLIPMARDNAEIILPFAISNSIASMFWYGVGETYFGLEVMTGTLATSSLTYLPKYAVDALEILGPRLPIAGAVIGALTAITAPILWSTSFRLFWDENLRVLLLADDLNWPLDLYANIVLPVGIPIGILAGSTLHIILKPLIVGVPSLPWHYTSLPFFLVVATLALVYVNSSMSAVENLFWVRRLDALTGKTYSYNTTTKKRHESSALADTADSKLKFIQVRKYLCQQIYDQYLQSKQTKPFTISTITIVLRQCTR